MLESLRRLPPWLLVSAISAGLIAGLVTIASAATGSQPATSTATISDPGPVVPSTNPAEASRSAAEASNAAEQNAYAVAVARIVASSSTASASAAQPPATTGSSPAKTTKSSPTATPTSSGPVLLDTNDACVLSVEEVVAIYQGLDAAITNNDAANQGQLLSQPISDFGIIAAHTQDSSLGAIITGLSTETTALQTVLLTGDSHPVTTRFDAQADQLATYCNAALS